MAKLSPPPKPDDPRFHDWLREMYALLVGLGVAEPAASALTPAQAADLVDGGESTGHYHAADRARANHTGSQPSSTISDFVPAVQALISTGGGHAALSNLGWTSSGHTGTASNLAGFNGSGAATTYAIPLTVPNGGTGRVTSTTAYGLLAAGTTATGAHQTLAAGATTEILVGGGASALPVWTTATGTGAPVREGSPSITGTLSVQAVAASGNIVLANATALLWKNTGGTDRGVLQKFSDDNVYLDSYDGSLVLRTGASPTTALTIDTSQVVSFTNPLAVTSGGTGRATSTTAYGLLAAGTTATGTHQTLAAGATTEILVGGGASALPVWTTATGSGAPVRATSPTFTTQITINRASVTPNLSFQIDGVTQYIQRAVGGAFAIVDSTATTTWASFGAASASILASTVTWGGNPTHSGNHTFSGTLTAGDDVILSSAEPIRRSVDSSFLLLQGGSTAADGGQILLYGNANATFPGQFKLTAQDGTGNTLTGTPAGALSWTGTGILSTGGVVQAGDGSAASPAYSFASSGNDDCGMYRAADNQVGIAAAGSQVATFDTSVGVRSPFAILSTGTDDGIGYSTGAGGTVTQGTSKSTTVVLNRVCGEITMHNATLNADTTVSFTFTNSALAATDLLLCVHASGGTVGAYTIHGRGTGAGSGTITVRNITTGNLGEAIVIRFAVIKGVTS